MTAQYKQLVKRLFIEVWNRGNLDLLEELIDQNYHSPNDPVHGPDSMKRFISVFLSAFPDMYFSIEEIIQENNSISVRWTANGTHLGNVMGIPATNARAYLSGIAVYHFTNGKIVQSWFYFDRLNLIQQLGVLPIQNSFGL